MGLRFSSRDSGDAVNRAIACRRGRVCVLGLGNTWAREGSKFHFLYTVLSLRYRGDKEISNGQLEIYVRRKGRKSGQEKEGNWEASSENDG